MYERSASVLERYFDKLFNFNKPNNLKNNFENYRELIKETKEYQKIIEEEEEVMKKFDEAATEIESLLNKQAQIHTSNLEIENERNQLFNDLGENPNTLDKKLQRIEEKSNKNQEEIKELREQYVKALVIFTERQKERNKHARLYRSAESKHIANIEKANKMFELIDAKDAIEMRNFIDSNKKVLQEEIINIMIQNGKNEKVDFNERVIKNAVAVRMQIAEKEAELYFSIYNYTKRVLEEIQNENVKLGRAEKILRDVGVKLAFLNAEKDYIVGFLDNERMAAMNGNRVHNKLMEEACNNFESDVTQINNLYQLVEKETIGKATKKAYQELYNRTYLKQIQQKEKKFETEVTNIRINMGTVINSNYWRIEGIKNIYTVFQEKISENFEKDLSGYQIEEKTKSKAYYDSIKKEEKEDIHEKNIEELMNRRKYNDNMKKISQSKVKEKNDIDEVYEIDEPDEIKEVDKIDDFDEKYREIIGNDQDEYEYEDPYKNAFKENEEKEMLEDRIDQIIKNSRKKSNRILGNREKQEDDRRIVKQAV